MAERRKITLVLKREMLRKQKNKINKQMKRKKILNSTHNGVTIFSAMIAGSPRRGIRNGSKYKSNR